VTEAVREVNFNIPIVIRMEGTNVEEGRKILRESGFNFTIAMGMKDGAEKVVEVLRKKG
jgi:succinyl-CoA synthetase beta subunit